MSDRVPQVMPLKQIKQLRLNLSEHAEQCNLVQWMTMRGIEFFSVPNGGKRDVITAAMLKREGVKAGAPDLVLVTQVQEHKAASAHVVIEMKRRYGSKTSDEQLRYHEIMRANGWIVICPPKGESASYVIRELIKLGY